MIMDDDHNKIGTENPVTNGDDSSKNVSGEEVSKMDDNKLNEVSDDLTLTLNAHEADVDLGEEVEDEANEEGDEDDEFSIKAILKALRLSTCVRVLGFKRSENPETDYANWYKFFKEDVKVEVPQIQTPGGGDLSIVFKMKSLEDKKQLFDYLKKNKYDGAKLRVKSINLNESKAVKNVGSLPLDEALNILYPGRNKLYADQLKDKFTRVKEIVEENLLSIKNIQKFTKSNKYLKGIKTKEMKPFSPIDGYENNVIIFIEKNAENGEVVHGLRAVSVDKKTIVPLEECLSVPRQMVLVTKSIITGLVGAGLEPYCPATDEGELLGLALRVSHQGTFMLTAIMKKPVSIDFHELTPEGIVLAEGETLGTPYRALIQNKIKEIGDKIKKFYEEEGKNMGIQSVYTTLLPAHVILIQMAARVWNNLPRPEHVAGEELLLDRINGVSLKVPWDREKNTEIYNNVLPLFDPFNFNSNTKVYLVSPIKQIGYYFAKKCAHVTQIETHSADYFKSNPLDGIKNITYVPFNAKLKKPISAVNCVVIWWPFFATNSSRKNTKKVSLLNQLLNFNITTMVFVSYLGRSNEHVQLQQPHMEKVYSKLKVSRIIPFDLEPYREGCGLFLLFKGTLDEHTGNGNSAPKAVPHFNSPKQFGKFGKRPPFIQKKGAVFSSKFRGDGFNGRGQPARDYDNDGSRYHVSVLERLGPRQPNYSSNYQGSAPDSPWQQDPPQNAWTQMQDVVGVVQNLQSMAQQMQVFMNQKQQAPSPQISSSWSLKRSHPDDEPYYSEKDSWGSGRPRDSWDTGRGGGESSDYGRWQSRSGESRDSYKYDDYGYSSKRRRDDLPDSRIDESWERRGVGSHQESDYPNYEDRPSSWSKQGSSGGSGYYSSSAGRSYY